MGCPRQGRSRGLSVPAITSYPSDLTAALAGWIRCPYRFEPFNSCRPGAVSTSVGSGSSDGLRIHDPKCSDEPSPDSCGRADEESGVNVGRRAELTSLFISGRSLRSSSSDLFCELLKDITLQSTPPPAMAARRQIVWATLRRPRARLAFRNSRASKRDMQERFRAVLLNWCRLMQEQ